MIFVTLGTQDKQFPRLLEAVENAIINEEVVIQKGSTKFETKNKNFEVYDYLNQQDFFKYMKEASCIITHAGVGTIIEGLKLRKKMIVAARLKKYKEHVNDHQLQILETFSEEGYILPLYDFNKLEELLYEDFTPKEFISNNKEFNEKLFEEING